MNPRILNYKELTARVTHLKVEKHNQELQLRQAVVQFIDTLNPISIAKKSLYTLAADTEVHFALAKVGLNIGANFLIEQILGKNRSVKGFLSSILVEIFSNTFINSHVAEIMEKVNQMINPSPKEEIKLKSEGVIE